MKNDISIREWITKFNNGEFSDNSVRTQINAGWYDWFCKDTSLKGKTYKMGNIVKGICDGGKVDLDNCYVWFKNNCPLNGPLYDDFRFARLDNGEVQMTIQIDCCWNKHKYTVYGRKTVGGEFGDEPLFETDSLRELRKWLNTPWEK